MVEAEGPKIFDLVSVGLYPDRHVETLDLQTTTRTKKQRRLEGGKS
jgi:hypothetical protein